MVQRKLNKPICKISSVPVFWFHEVVTSDWICRRCKQKQKRGTMSVEIPVGVSGAALNTQVYKARNFVRRVYICLSCAESLFKEAQVEVALMKKFGKDGKRLLDNL